MLHNPLLHPFVGAFFGSTDSLVLNGFEFEDFRAKVKVTVALCRKNIVIALTPSFLDRF